MSDEESTDRSTSLVRGHPLASGGPASAAAVQQHQEEGSQPPRLADVLAARGRIASYLPRSPLRAYPALDRIVGAELWVKHENLLPTGAFKVRGGVNLMSQLDDTARRRGLATASTGNHGQSIAFAARLFGVAVTVCAPRGANPVKVEAMRDLGADVVLVGHDFDEARRHCEQLAEERGLRYVSPANDPELIAGVGTCTLELLEEAPGIEVIVVPVGAGSGASGACIVARAANPGIEVIAVQSAQAPAAHDSWAAGELVDRKSTTAAEGMSTGTGFALPQSIMRDGLTDFVLIDDAELLHATRLMVEKTRTLVEPAGAGPLAAALASDLNPRLRGRRVALICSGGNIAPEQLRAVLGA